ncbi:MAG: Ser-Thr-rich GPI-anchored membrane family protein [Cyclobacteriaceae bacterium]
MRKKVIVALLLAATAAQAQKASIKRVELAGEKIVVHYDLEDSNPANEYQISLYSSQSNFGTALTKVRGDVGTEIKPGANKKIEWSIREELGPFKGKISLEIRGKMFVPVAKINSISEGDKFKRGKSHTVTWKPGNSNQITIELMKGDQPIQTQNNQSNNGTYSFLIAPHTTVGNDYSIRITDTKDGENVVRSQPFAVTRKVPLLLKVLPIVAVGGAAAVLLGGGGGTPDPGTGNNGGSTQIELPEFP